MTPSKTNIDRAVADGTFERANRLLSAAHLLICQANELFQEGDDLLMSHHIILGYTKKQRTALYRAFDAYLTEFSKLVNTQQQKMWFFEDLESLNTLFRRWLEEKDTTITQTIQNINNHVQ